MKALILAALVIGLATPARAVGQGAGGAEVLTNEAIISMTDAKVGKDLLMTKVNTTKNTFDVTVNGLVSLYQGKVNQDVIRAMISAAANSKLGPPAPKTAEVLDNQSVITMIMGKLPKAIMITKIQNTKAAYDLSSTGLVSLTQAKVPNDIIQAMMAKAGSAPVKGAGSIQ